MGLVATVPVLPVAVALLAVGGAISTAPDMHRFLVERNAWLTDPQFNASIAIAQAAPGPNVLFIALLGWNIGINAGGPGAAGWALGLLGILVCMVGVMLPSSLLTWQATRWGHRNRNRRSVRAFKQGMAPVVIGLLLATAWVLTRAHGLNWSTGRCGPSRPPPPCWCGAPSCTCCGCWGRRRGRGHGLDLNGLGRQPGPSR